MDKGIRPYVLKLFLEQLPKYQPGFGTRLGNLAFRSHITGELMEQFGIPITAAAAHYNYAFIQVKKNNPEFVIGLGRPEDKKGGRKKKVNAALVTETEGAVQFPTAESIAAEGAAAASEEPSAEVAHNEEGVVTQGDDVEVLVNVVRVKDGEMVASQITQTAAQEMISAAAKAKKAKLQIA